MPAVPVTRGCSHESIDPLFNYRGDLLHHGLALPSPPHNAEQSPDLGQQYTHKHRGGKRAGVSQRKYTEKLVMAGILLLGACASTPAPQAALQAAEMAITSAEQARVADYAAPELGEARSKLTAARTAIQEKDMVLAERLAEQSRLGAELAIARVEVEKTKAVNDEMRHRIRRYLRCADLYD